MWQRKKGRGYEGREEEIDVLWVDNAARGKSG